MLHWTYWTDSCAVEPSYCSQHPVCGLFKLQTLGKSLTRLTLPNSLIFYKVLTTAFDSELQSLLFLYISRIKTCIKQSVSRPLIFLKSNHKLIMMCFLYDEQFPVLHDIIQISGPDQAISSQTESV